MESENQNPDYKEELRKGGKYRNHSDYLRDYNHDYSPFKNKYKKK
jgi:hypothetical protein